MTDSSDKTELNHSKLEDLEIEKIIQSLPLKTPSAACDSGVFVALKLGQQAMTSDVSSPRLQTGKTSSGVLFSLLSTAAALLVGFLLGTLVNRPPADNSLVDENTNPQQMLAGFELSDNVKIIEGKSRTLIVEDRIQMQNDVPVRKLETVTHKKVKVRDSRDQPEKEIEIPIRKVFFTLAETI